MNELNISKFFYYKTVIIQYEEVCLTAYFKGYELSPCHKL